jgi:serine/threonine-protein kinase
MSPKDDALDAKTNAAAAENIPAELLSALRRDLSRQYQITDLLGRGGMSLVYLAQEVELNRQVAIKVLPLQLLHGADAAERFEREGKIAASLDHPHIVPIFRVGSTSTFLWYTMKRIRGRSLEQIIAERGGLPVADVLSIVQQVGDALQYAHRQGVVHRDVKPANVLIEESGWAYVCDFGVARAFGSVSLTQTGASLGTPRYMAPEQVEGKPVDGRCDQYSLAILVWEALTGELPFTGESVGELIRKHLLEPAPPLSDARHDIPVNVSDAVGRAMSKNPAERFPDVAAFIRALGGDTDRRVSAAFTSASPAVTSRRALADAPTIPLPQPRRRRVLVLSVVAGAVLVGGGIWSALRPSGPANGATPHRIVDSVSQDSSSLRTVATPPADTIRPRQPAAAHARLSLSTQPPGMLFLDGKPIRYTPVIGLDISAGRHLVQVKRDGFAPFDTVFTAAPGQEIKWTRKTLTPIGS